MKKNYERRQMIFIYSKKVVIYCEVTCNIYGIMRVGKNWINAISASL